MAEKKTLKSLLGSFISKKTESAPAAPPHENEKKRRRLDPIASGPPGNGRPTRNLYVGNLHPNTSDRDLQVVFGLHCEVHSVVMMKGFCFVNTASVEGATKALHALQGSRILGNEVKVNYAKDKFEGKPQPPALLPLSSSSSSSATTVAIAPPPGLRGSYAAPPGVALLAPGMMTDTRGEGGGTNHFLDARAPSTMAGGGQVPTASLHVAGYGSDPSVSSTSVARRFKEFGELISVAMKEQYCFVNFTCVDAAVRAKAALTGTSLSSFHERPLVIRFAREATRGASHHHPTTTAQQSSNRGSNSSSSGGGDRVSSKRTSAALQNDEAEIGQGISLAQVEKTPDDTTESSRSPPLPSRPAALITGQEDNHQEDDAADGSESPIFIPGAASAAAAAAAEDGGDENGHSCGGIDFGEGCGDNADGDGTIGKKNESALTGSGGSGGGDSPLFVPGMATGGGVN